MNFPEAPGLVLGGTHPPQPLPCLSRPNALQGPRAPAPPFNQPRRPDPTRCPVAQGSLDPPGEPQLPILQQGLRHTPCPCPSCLCVANLKAGNECPGWSQQSVASPTQAYPWAKPAQTPSQAPHRTHVPGASAFGLSLVGSGFQGVGFACGYLLCGPGQASASLWASVPSATGIRDRPERI